MRIDFDYLCRITANLSGIPVRVYRGEEGNGLPQPLAGLRNDRFGHFATAP